MVSRPEITGRRARTVSRGSRGRTAVLHCIRREESSVGRVRAFALAGPAPSFRREPVQFVEPVEDQLQLTRCRIDAAAGHHKVLAVRRHVVIQGDRLEVVWPGEHRLDRSAREYATEADAHGEERVAFREEDLTTIARPYRSGSAIDRNVSS